MFKKADYFALFGVVGACPAAGITGNPTMGALLHFSAVGTLRHTVPGRRRLALLLKTTFFGVALFKNRIFWNCQGLHYWALRKVIRLCAIGAVRRSLFPARESMGMKVRAEHVR